MTKLRFLKDIARQMSKNSRSRRTSNKQHGKRSQTLLKSAWKHLHHIYWSIWKTLIWEKSLLAIGKILGLFVNTLTGDDKYWLINCDKSTQSILMQLFKKQKTFSLFFFFFFAFLNFRSNFEHFQKKYDPLSFRISDINFRFRRPFNKHNGKRYQTLLKSPRQHLPHIYWSLQRELSSKKPRLVIFKILRLLVNTFTANDKYSLPNYDNFSQPIQMQLSKNIVPNTVENFMIAALSSLLINMKKIKL